MSNMTHIFEIKQTETTHHLISSDPNLIITAQGAAGEANTYMASKWGESNHVANFVSGTDKIRVPLEVIKELNASTTIVKGTLPAEKFTDSGPTADTIFYDDGVLYYSKTIDGGDLTALLTLDGTPALAAADIEIV